MAFVPFLMLHHFSGIIYLILFALHPLTCHLEKISKLIYSTKLFLLRLSSLQISSLAFDCFVLLLSSLDKLASNLRLLGELATRKLKKFYYYYYYIIIIIIVIIVIIIIIIYMHGYFILYLYLNLFMFNFFLSIHIQVPIYILPYLDS